jgi:hypothetical protein
MNTEYMVIISFQDGSDWCKANWVFRQIAADVMARSPKDGDLNLIMEKAQAFGHLDLVHMDRAMAARVLKAIREVLEDTVSGRIPGWEETKPADQDRKGMYMKSIAELLGRIVKQKTDA